MLPARCPARRPRHTSSAPSPPISAICFTLLALPPDSAYLRSKPALPRVSQGSRLPQPRPASGAVDQRGRFRRQAGRPQRGCHQHQPAADAHANVTSRKLCTCCPSRKPLGQRGSRGVFRRRQGQPMRRCSAAYSRPQARPLGRRQQRPSSRTSPGMAMPTCSFRAQKNQQAGCHQRCGLVSAAWVRWRRPRRRL